MPSPEYTVEQHGRIRYLSAREFRITTGRDDMWFKIAQVRFGGDGSVYFSFPYFRKCEGILAEARYKTSESPNSISFHERGRTTSHLVKVSHHTSGEVLFTQTGKIRSEIRTRTFGLTEGNGFLVQQNIYGVSSCTKLKPDELHGAKLYLQARDRTEGRDCAIVSLEWQRLDWIESLADPSAESIGPMVDVYKASLGGQYPAFIVAPPRRSPVDGHALVVSVGPAPPVPGDSGEPWMVVMAGWNTQNPDDNGNDGVMLAALYPVNLTEEQRAQLGSLDLPPTPKAPSGSAA